jgi:hypothetical protein
MVFAIAFFATKDFLNCIFKKFVFPKKFHLTACSGGCGHGCCRDRRRLERFPLVRYRRYAPETALIRNAQHVKKPQSPHTLRPRYIKVKLKFIERKTFKSKNNKINLLTKKNSGKKFAILLAFVLWAKTVCY